MHWRIKTGRFTWKDLFSLKDNEEDNDMILDEDNKDEIEPQIDAMNKQNHSSTKSNGSSLSSNSSNGSNNGNTNGLIVCCPICIEQVSGLRFANHLEKCMRGGKRGARGSRPFTELSLPYTYPKVRVDPYPQSLVIRFKIKNGQVRTGQIREGASLDEFKRSKQQLEEGEKPQTDSAEL